MENRDAVLLAIGELKGQLGGFIAAQANQDKRLDAQDKRFDDHSNRLRKVEDNNTKAKGVIIGVSGAVSAAVAYMPVIVGYIVGKHG